MTSIMSECSHFLIIISAAGITSEWVLTEIDLARQRREKDACFTILPLVVGEVGPYEGHEFLERFQRIPYHSNFSHQLEAVAGCLFIRPAVPARFRELTEHFTGREYVFSAIDTFLNENDRGLFTIIGDPGEGKSAICAEFTRRTGCVAHFNLRADGTNRIDQCVRSIYQQLSARLGLDLVGPPSDPSEIGPYWRILFLRAMAHLGGGERLVIAIDALDEVDLSNHPAGANVLFLPPALPEGIFFVLTRRRVNIPLVSQSPQCVFDLLKYRAQSLADIEGYIRQSLTRLDLTSWIQRQGLSGQRFAEDLAQKSQFNFMYLHYVLPEIEKGAYRSSDLEELPEGLRGYYENHWERMGMRQTPLPRKKIRIVYVMAEVGRPVSRSFLSRLVGEDQIAVQEVIDEWRQFLHEGETNGELRYSVYHASFLDFLHDKEIVQSAEETIEGIHAVISDSLWSELSESNVRGDG